MSWLNRLEAEVNPRLAALGVPAICVARVKPDGALAAPFRQPEVR